MIATGVLYLPYGFSLAGILPSIFILPICSLITFLGYYKMIMAATKFNGQYS